MRSFAIIPPFTSISDLLFILSNGTVQIEEILITFKCSPSSHDSVRLFRKRRDINQPLDKIITPILLPFLFQVKK